MTVRSALEHQADVLALAAGFVHDTYDPELLDDAAVWSLMDELEQAKPLNVAIGSAGLIWALVLELAAVRGEPAEDVLQRVALTAASRIPPNPPTPEEA